MTDLSQTLEHLENVHVSTLEKDGQVTFLHKIAQGPADKSYGIHVAKIAGMPEELLQRADRILQTLENQAPTAPTHPAPSVVEEPSGQLDLFADTPSHPVLDELEKLDIYNMTPMEVMMAVAELKKKI